MIYGIAVIVIVIVATILVSGTGIEASVDSLTETHKDILYELQKTRKVHQNINNNIVGVGKQLEDFNTKFKGDKE